MHDRSRVSLILNSEAFRRELEEVVEEQIKSGPHPASLLALQQITDLLLPHSKGQTGLISRGSKYRQPIQCVHVPVLCRKRIVCRKRQKSYEICRKRINYNKIKAICAEKNFNTLRIKKNRVHSETHQGSIVCRKVSNKMWTSFPRSKLVMQREKIKIHNALIMVKEQTSL